MDTKWMEKEMPACVSKSSIVEEKQQQQMKKKKEQQKRMLKWLNNNNNKEWSYTLEKQHRVEREREIYVHSEM